MMMWMNRCSIFLGLRCYRVAVEQKDDERPQALNALSGSGSCRFIVVSPLSQTANRWSSFFLLVRFSNNARFNRLSTCWGLMCNYLPVQKSSWKEKLQNEMRVWWYNLKIDPNVLEEKSNENMCSVMFIQVQLCESCFQCK